MAGEPIVHVARPMDTKQRALLDALYAEAVKLRDFIRDDVMDDTKFRAAYPNYRTICPLPRLLAEAMMHSLPPPEAKRMLTLLGNATTELDNARRNLTNLIRYLRATTKALDAFDDPAP